MTEFVDSILHLVAAHRAWAYGLAYVLALAEALPVVGTVVPGSILIVGLGALVPSGAMELWPLVFWSTLGAISGDGGSYWLGRRFQHQIFRVWPFRRYPGLIARGESLFRSQGGKAVFVSRFVQGPRAFVPLAAGVLGMPTSRFLAVNMASAVVWAPSHILAGAVLGGSVALAGAVAGRLAVLFGLALVVVWISLWLVRHGLRLAPRLWAVVQGRALAWARAGSGPAHREVAALLDTRRPEAAALALAAAVLAGAVWLFLGILEDVVSGDPLVRADAAVFHFLQGLRTPWADRLLIGVTELGDKAVVLPVAAAVLVWLAWRHAWRGAAYWLGGLVFASLFGTLLKLGLHRPRPMAIYEGVSAYAFPSGHATMSMVLWGLLGVFIAREARPGWWPWIFGAGATIVSLIAFSRLYLGVHWLSDVLGGLAFGTAWVALLSVAYLRHRPQAIGGGALALIAGGAFLIAGAAHIRAGYPADAEHYAARPNPVVIAYDTWRQAAWRDLPARRTDMAGAAEEPLTVQWAGSLAPLREALVRAGWRAPVPWSAGGALAWFNPRAGAAALPVLPKFHGGRRPVLTLIRVADGLPAGAARLVLRLWPSGVRLATGAPPPRRLWLGEAVAESVSRPLGLLTIARTRRDFDAPLAALTGALDPNTFVERRRGIATAGWRGRVILGPVGLASRPQR